MNPAFQLGICLDLLAPDDANDNTKGLLYNQNISPPFVHSEWRGPTDHEANSNRPVPTGPSWFP